MRSNDNTPKRDIDIAIKADKNILRLDWHKEDEKENNADQAKLVENKSYLDWIIEKTL